MQAEIIYIYYLWCSAEEFLINLVYVHSVKRASKSARSCVSLHRFLTARECLLTHVIML